MSIVLGNGREDLEGQGEQRGEENYSRGIGGLHGRCA